MPTSAKVTLLDSSYSVVGSLTLTQSSDAVTITGQLENLTPGNKHGLAVCTYGDLDMENNNNTIFNPFGKSHGSPADAQHMVGDLGNVTVDESGNAKVDLKFSTSSNNNNTPVLIGPHSIIGRSIVLFAGQDDMGRGGHASSSSTGNAGPKIAIGVIGLIK